MNDRLARRGRRYLHKAQQTQERNSQALSGFRTRDTSNRSAADDDIDSHQDQPPSSLFTIIQTFDQTQAVETLLLNNLKKI